MMTPLMQLLSGFFPGGVAGSETPKLMGAAGAFLGHPTSGAGMVEPGNIDYAKEQPPVFNPDGSVSSIQSMVFGTDNGNSVIVPTVFGGMHHTPDEAVKRYYDTGKHMGMFANDQQALSFEKPLHEADVNRIMEFLNKFPPPGGGWGQPK